MVSYRRGDISRSQSLDCLLWLGRPAAQLEHPHTCVWCVCICELEDRVGYREGATGTTRGISEGHPGTTERAVILV